MDIFHEIRSHCLHKNTSRWSLECLYAFNPLCILSRRDLCALILHLTCQHPSVIHIFFHPLRVIMMFIFASGRCMALRAICYDRLYIASVIFSLPLLCCVSSSKNIASAKSLIWWSKIHILSVLRHSIGVTMIIVSKYMLSWHMISHSFI